LVAFSNSGGGCVLVGVNDEGKVLGISDINEEKSKIETIARNCDTSISAKISSHEKEGKTILLIDVPEGKDKHSTGQINYEEKICKKFDYLEDFDEDAFEEFIRMAVISKGRLSNEDILINLGVAEQDGKNLVFNNVGVLFSLKTLQNS